MNRKTVSRPTSGVRHLASGILFLTILVSCQPKEDIQGAAHPVHADMFMTRKLEAQIQDQRKKRDEFFRTDPDSPLPPEVKLFFKGLEYYPIDLQYRFEGPVVRYPDPPRFTMISTDGEKRQAIKFGTIKLDIREKDYTLQVYRLLDVDEKNMLFIPFTDANAGKETYPAGRYIDLEEKSNGLYLLDFNGAYNPSCAYGGNYSCPVTPEENHLSIAIPAGEKILPLSSKVEGH